MLLVHNSRCYTSFVFVASHHLVFMYTDYRLLFTAEPPTAGWAGRLLVLGFHITHIVSGFNKKVLKHKTILEHTNLILFYRWVYTRPKYV